jgi:hypothetical protein
MMPPGQAGGPEGQIPPELLQALMAQQGGGQAPPPQAAAGPQVLSPEEIINIIQGLQSGELTPEDLPPEVLAQVEEFLAQQGGGQAPPPAPAEMQAPQGGVPEELALIIEGLQSGDLNPEDVPPEILAKIEAMMQGQQQ